MSRLTRTVGAAALAAVAGAVTALARSTDWFASFGARATGARLERMRRSRQWEGGRFVNSLPTRTLQAKDAGRTLRLQLAAGESRYPTHPIPVETRRRGDFDAPPESGLRATRMGHATVLLEIDGARVLTDPVWSERVSPSSLVGPKRFFEPPIPLADLPAIDAVVLSHDHYDHLDKESARELAARGTVFLAPLGVGAHLERWGVDPGRIRELDWGESTTVAGLTLTETPARHFSGRRLSDRDATLWGSWVLAGSRHRVFYSGDSGYFDGFEAIGRAHGPFDLSVMSTGAYGPTWPLIHMTPEEVVRAHVDVRGGLLLPVHWGTFNLAFHPWNEPAIRTVAEARRIGVAYVVPRPGQMVEPSRISSAAPGAGDADDAGDADEVAWWRD